MFGYELPIGTQHLRPLVLLVLTMQKELSCDMHSVLNVALSVITLTHIIDMCHGLDQCMITVNSTYQHLKIRM